MMRQVLVLRLISLLGLLWLAVMLSVPVQAQSFGEINIEPTLVAESDVPAPGKTVMLAIQMDPKPGWHGYWINGGETSKVPSYIWTLPKGVQAGPIQYPVPEKLLVLGLMSHAYEGQHALLVPLSLPADLKPGSTIAVSVKASFLACTDKICLPQDNIVRTLNLTVGDGAIQSQKRRQFDTWRSRIPRPIGATARFSGDARSVRLALPFSSRGDVSRYWFFMENEGVVDYKEPQKILQTGDELLIEIKRSSGDLPKALRGILATGAHQGFSISAKSGVVIAKDEGLAESPLKTTLLALLGAILGGILLNFMPCVFPVISLKALSFARLGADEREAKTDARFYLFGALAMSLALGGILLALRASGVAVGWAFQLQDPRIILVLLVLMTAIAGALAGLFHLPAITGGQSLAVQGGWAGSFWTGALAAFVATPCTGPFMAAALGAALVLPTWAALSIFAGLGLGLAIPFVALAYSPGLRARLPKPGPWMITLQRILTIPMALTALALLWLLHRQTGTTGLWIGLVASLLVLLLLALLGHYQRQPDQKSALGWGAALGSVLLLAGASAVLPPAGLNRAGLVGAISFSNAKLAELRASGKPVFLYFTADWCVTCKVNEKLAIDRDAVGRTFKEKGVTVMVGDWSTPDPEITRFLEGQGRSGIPLYLAYQSGQPAPQVLPQLLTETMLVEAF